MIKMIIFYICIILALPSLVIFLFLLFKPSSASSKKINTSDGLNQEEQDSFIKETNAYRTRAKALPLSWDNNLAKSAQAWVDFLCENEGCKMRHPSTESEKNKYLNNNTYGQNLAWFEGYPGSPAESVKNWGPVECKQYDPNSPTRGTAGGEVGHFTQLVWKSTKSQGCGAATNGKETLYACNYSPAGNVIYNGGFSLYNENVKKPNPCS